jgi:hypothetical protein
MAISLVEAMQMGLVPVVTPVGEMRTYCIRNEKSIPIDDDDQALDDIACVIECEDNYSSLQTAAISQWSNAKLYCESILEASNELVEELSDT